MVSKSVAYVSVLLAILFFIGTGVAVASTETEFDEQQGEPDEQTTQQFNDLQLLSYSIEHINQALQRFIQGDAENAQEHLTISSEQIATVLGRLQAAQTE